MRSDKPRLFAALENVFDVSLNLALMIVAYMLTILIYGRTSFDIYDHAVITGLFVAVLLLWFIYQLFNLYRPIPYARVAHFIHHIVRANLIFAFIAIVLTTTFFIGEKRYFLLIWIGLFFFISTALLLLKKRLIVFLTVSMRKKHNGLQRAVIVGDNVQTAKEYITQITENSRYGIEIIGAVGRKMSPEVGCDKLGDFEDLETVLDTYTPNLVVFAVDSYDKESLIKLVNMCDDRCIKVHFLPVIYGLLKSHRQIERIGYMTIINIHSTPLDNPANAAVKRAVDIIGSLALILVTAPIMIFAAIGVFISSPGPVIFKQKRVGKMGKPFTMYKFRSMRINRESDRAWSHKGDSRKTKFGAFIRSTAIDELPQLFNVLAGDMSLVGPRPEIPHFVEEFKQIIPLYMVKHYVKPGITGLAQIKGLRGDTSVEMRIREDIEYIENWSLSLDLGILFATPFKAFNKNEIYMTPSEQTGESSDSDAEDGSDDCDSAEVEVNNE